MEYEIQNDKALNEIENQVELLQSRLKDRLEETQSIDELSKQVSANTFQLEKSTEGLEKTAEETKWLLFIKLWKWYIALGGVAFLIFFMVIRSIRG